MLRAGAIGLIEVYQRRLSPLKGFTCAHLVLHGGVSCSQAVKLAIDEDGLSAGWRAVKARASSCRAAMIALQTSAEEGKTGQDHSAGRRRGQRSRRFTDESCCLIHGGAEVCFSACFLSSFS